MSRVYFEAHQTFYLASTSILTLPRILFQCPYSIRLTATVAFYLKLLYLFKKSATPVILQHYLRQPILVSIICQEFIVIFQEFCSSLSFICLESCSIRLCSALLVFAAFDQFQHYLPGTLQHLALFNSISQELRSVWSCSTVFCQEVYIIWQCSVLFAKKCVASGLVPQYFVKKCVASGIVQYYLRRSVKRLVLFSIICLEVSSVWPCSVLFSKKCEASSLVPLYFVKKCVASGIVQYYLRRSVKRLVLFSIICLDVSSVWPCSVLFSKKCEASGLVPQYIVKKCVASGIVLHYLPRNV